MKRKQNTNNFVHESNLKILWHDYMPWGSMRSYGIYAMKFTRVNKQVLEDVPLYSILNSISSCH